MTSDMKYFKEKKVWPRMDEKALLSALESGDDKLLDTKFIIANRPTLHHIYMRESCSGFIKDEFLKDNPKLQWLEDFLDGNEGRIVVFTNFVAETIIINRLCLELKRHCCIYDGANKDLTNWNEYEDCVAVVNIVAGGAGINDFAKTNIAIFFSPPENHIDFEQAKGRIDRIGQTKQPVYYYLQIMNSVEPAIYRNLKDGKDFDDRMFEEWLEKGE
jgi:SNF2 family DNA or RNA helicase